jgi:tetratricopeptide (TPR) repeat protein
VNAAVPDALEAGDPALTWLWDGLTLAEKIYAAALAHTAEEGELIPRERVIKVLANHSARLHFSEMGSAPRTLVTRRVLNEAGQNEYRFAIEIFRRWVRQRKPLDDIKNELDREEPEAHRFYQIGQHYFTYSEWQNAIDYFQKALEQHPRHFRARLHLGEAQLEQGRIEQAVDTLEQAYELDQNDTLLSLLRALREQAEDKAEDEHGLLAVCERILTIYPEEQFARDKKKYILTGRGNAAFEKDNLEAALADYQAANTPPQIMLIEVLLRLTEPTVEDQEQKSSQLWAKASDLFGELAKASDEAASQVNWQAKREQYREVIAERLLDIGKDFFLQNQYEMAIGFFRETLAVDAEHVLAQLRLGEALLKQGKIDEAVSQLEHAYQQKPEEARKPLTEALVVQARMLEGAGDEEGGLARCQRILQVSPDETAAQEIHNRIWTQRGDIFIENDDFNSAIKAYQKAGNTKRKDAVERLRKQLQLSGREKEARDHECRENWSEAATIYKQLVNKALYEKKKYAWQKAVDRCQDETKVAQRFSEGLRAIESQNWHKAQAAFREIINHRITYQKDGIWAIDLLAEVAKKNAYTAPLIPLPVLKASKVISIDHVSQLEQIADWEALPRIINAVYTLDGEVLIITSAEGAYILDPLTLTRVGLLKTNATAKSFALSPDGEKIAFGMADGTIQVRQIENSSLLYGPLTVHSTVVNCVAFSPDGETLVSGANDGAIAFWQVKSGLIQNILPGHTKAVWDVIFSPNGQLLASASRDATIKLWDVQNMTLLHTLAKHTRPVWKICFSPDGTNLASASSDRTIRLWQVSHGELLLTLKKHIKPVDSVAYSPKGTILASGSRDKTLRLWQVEGGKLRHTISDFEGDVTSVAFAPDGTAIVSVSNHRLVQLWAVKK